MAYNSIEKKRLEEYKKILNMAEKKQSSINMPLPTVPGATNFLPTRSGQMANQIKLSQNEEKNNTWLKKSSAMEDENKLRGIAKTIASTGYDVSGNFLKGVGSIIEGTTDTIKYGYAGIQKVLGNDEKAEKIKNEASQINNFENFLGYNKNVDKNSILGDKADSIAQGLGYVGGIIATGNLGAAAGLGTTGITTLTTGITGTSAMGSAMTEAYQNGATDGEALTYGLISGIAEAGTELIFGGLGKSLNAVGISKGLSSADDILAKKISSKFKSQLAKNLTEYSVKSLAEGSEEVMSGVIQAIGKKITYMSEEELAQIIKDEQLLDQFISGAIISGMTQAPSLVKTTIQGQDFIQKEITEQSTALPTVNDIVNQEQTTNSNSNQVNLPIVNDLVKNSINTNELSNQTLPVKKLDFIESARKYNIDTNNDTIRSINKTLSQRNINASWDDKVFKSSKQNAIWKLNSDGTREIIFNPKAETGDLLQNVAVHELYHDLTTSQNGNVIKNEILEFAKTKEGYQEARLDLEKTYSEIYDKNSTEFQQLVDEEVVASILGNKLGDQQFVSQLTIQKPSLARQIYNWVVDKLNSLNKSIGYKSERLFWEDIKNKFENTYREQYNRGFNTNINEKHSTIGLKGAKNLEKNSKSDYYRNLYQNQKNASEIFNNSTTDIETTNIQSKKETGWYKTKYGDWGTLISDKNSKLTQKLKPNHTYKLGEILEHDLLYKAYPELKKLKVITADIETTGGYSNVSFLPANTIINEIYIRNSDLNRKDFRKTLLHEINHYIEHKENYDKRSRGSNSKIVGEKDYRNNVGEIISNETKINADLTQQELNDIILPEQAKQNPKYENIKQKLLESNKKDLIKSGDGKNALQNLEISIQNKVKNTKVDNKQNNNIRRINNDVDEGLDNSSFSINENSNWQEHLNKNYQSTGKGQTLQDVKLPTRQDEKRINMPVIEKKITPSKKSKEIATILNETMQDNKIETKQRSWIDTSLESESIKDKLLIENLDSNKINYVVQSNKKTLEQANNKLNSMGYETSVKYIQSKINDNDISLTDIVLAERLIQEALNNGDNQLASDLLMDTAIMGTELGQKVQALSIIQRLTPEGQLKFYQKLVQRAKTKGETSFKNVEITPEMVDLILNAYNSDGTFDQNDLNDRVEQFKQKVADQLITTKSEKIVAWRYLSMLGNPKTHIRNVVSNVAMWGTLKVKNATARTLETILPVKNRTKTWEKASDVVSDFAKKTTTEMKSVITGEGKYSEKTSIENKKQTFKNKTLEKIKDFNSDLLSKEDWMFSKTAFENTFKEYLTANGIKTETDITNNPEIIEKAKLYALEQAEIATFRQYSWLANQISKIENKNFATKMVVGSTIPFKKTPINIAKAGVKYSPIGLIKSISYDVYQVSKGNMEASQMIDNLSQGLVGSSLALIGYALAKSGILKGAGDEDKEGKYDSYLGNQTYSIKIGDATYSISWLSPVAMPLLVGATAYEKLEEQSEWDMNVVIDTLAQTLDPLSEMSFLSSLDDVLSSYDSGVKKIAGMVGSMGQNYLTQFIPTLVSQFASTLDDKKRTTRASNNSSFKYGEETVRKIMYKIPILRNQLEVSTDIWGNEINQSDNIIERAIENFIAPYSKKEDISTSLDTELKRIYNSTGETSVIPGVPKAFVKYDEVTYQMSASEYTQYKKTYGQTANNYLNSLINNVNYKNATDEEKVKMIKEIYSFASATASEEYFSNKSVNYETDTLEEVQKIKELKMTNDQVAEYVAQKKIISTIKNDENITTQEKKIKICKNLINTNLNDEQLVYLYNKYYSSEKTLNSLLNANIPIKEFIKFNSQEFTTDYYENGKAITNSRKNKVIKYINSLNLSIPQKAILIKMEYSSYDNYNSQIVNYINKMNYSKFEKASLLKSFGFDNYDKYLINYVNNMNISKDEKTDMLEELGFTIRDGRVYY